MRLYKVELPFIEKIQITFVTDPLIVEKLYNEAIDDEVMEVLQDCVRGSYTKFMGVFGKGELSGTHLGNDIWPGKNNVLLIACRDEEARKILSCVEKLRQTLSKEGVKAFVWNLEETGI
jgi:nitrogen regulatory protein PII